MNDCVLELKNISKTFPSVKALDKVDFSLKKGEIHSLIGENGAGKSTLINVIIGLFRPDEGGEIIVRDQKTVFNSPMDSMKNGISIVPQELNLIPEMSVGENIFLGTGKVNKGTLKKINWNGLYSDANESMSSLGISLDVKEKVGGMSVANQQLVQIARALAFGSDIIIFDEPTACLTLKETERLLSMLENFRDQGKSIIFVSHHLDEVIRISDRVTVMRDGKKVEVLERENFSIQRFIKGMVGKDVQYQKLKRNIDENSEVVVKVEGLTREREFNNISFEVKKGEIFGIAGLVGAGRTELVSTVFGERKPDAGDVYIRGKKITDYSPRKAIDLGMGYLPEERRAHGIIPLLSVRENITIASLDKIYKFPRINRTKEKDVVVDYIKKISIKASSMEQQINQLSGGNQQKTILARWMAVGCDILILDEPTRGIDVLAKEEIHQLIREMADNGMTVIVVSSEMEELIAITNRILIMHEGQFKGICQTDDVNPEEILNIALSKD
ncbi:MAG: sugar ABC transporter ATP-binding protein [Acetivibrionales bacterium]